MATKQFIAKERKNLMALMDKGDYKIPSRKLNENLLIATWNIQQFSDKKTLRALKYIADVVERFDIVALQEVKSNLEGLSKLQDLLPGNYKILVSDTTGNYERFAFLYDKRSVISTGLVCEIGFNVPGATHTGYQLHRMPYCASFRAGRFDFVIANNHIYFGKGAKGEAAREQEILALADFIDRRSKAKRGRVFDRDFFVVGDFNIPKMGDKFFNALKSKGFLTPDNSDTLTTNFNRTKTYDKIAWVKRKVFNATGKCNVVPFGKVVFQDTPSKGKNEISDHLPLWAEFEINSFTQKLDQIINAK